MKGVDKLHKDLYANAVLYVDTAMLASIDERTTKEIVAFAPSTLKIKVVAHQCASTPLGWRALTIPATCPVHGLKH